MDPGFLKAEELATQLMTQLTINEMGAGIKIRSGRKEGKLGYCVTVTRLLDGVRMEGFVAIESMDWLDKIREEFRIKMGLEEKTQC